MSIELTAEQWTNTREVSTRPIRLIEWQHAGYTETLSESGNVEYDGALYTAGGIFSVTVDDGRSAVITLPATNERIAETIGGRWRGGKICKIIAIPGMPDDELIYTAEQGIVVLDGIIDGSEYSGGLLSVRVIHKYVSGKQTPRQTFNAFSAILPPAGSLVIWEGETFMLGSRR